MGIRGPIIPDWPPQQWLNPQLMNTSKSISNSFPWTQPGSVVVEPQKTIFQSEKPLERTSVKKKKKDALLETPEAKQFLKDVEELYFSGGGGAGSALPAAVEEAVNFGLDLKKVKRIVAASVGVFVATALVLEIPVGELQSLLDKMPRDSFQDWDWWQSLSGFAQTWGWCKGEAMTDYFRSLIKERTGLDDPTFLELYEAGFTKELCIVTTNITQGGIAKFSYRETPDKKVAEVLTLACSVPLVYPPKWVVNGKGERELHTDGGIINNYPWGVGSSENVTNEKRLGFVFVNKAVGYSMDGIKNITDSFWKYIGQTFWIFIFRHPLSLGDDVKRRTAAIQVDYNPLKFQPNEEQQVELSRAGRKSIRNLIWHNLSLNYEVERNKFWEMAKAVAPRAGESHDQLETEQAEFTQPILFKDPFNGSTEPSMQSEDRSFLETPTYSGIRSAVCAPTA